MVKEFFLKFCHQWKVLLKDRTYLVSLLIGLLVLGGAYMFQHVAHFYNDLYFYSPVGDLILDEIPTYNLDFLFQWGFYFLIVLTFIYPVFVRPELSPFMLKTFGILLVVRTCFTILTHLGPPAGFFYENGVGLEVTPFFINDLFFSGHTALPFLAFLLFKETRLRWVMLMGSFVMGATVLLMHIHYSIDVFAAFFIAYGVYAFSDRIFNNLNLRFTRRIKLHGWTAFQKRIHTLRERRRLRKETVEGVGEILKKD